MKIDKIDKKILDVLQQDGRMSASNIANNLNINIDLNPIANTFNMYLESTVSRFYNSYCTCT